MTMAPWVVPFRCPLVALSGQPAPMNVRFEANNGHDAGVTRCLLMNSGTKCRSGPR